MSNLFSFSFLPLNEKLPLSPVMTSALSTGASNCTTVGRAAPDPFATEEQVEWLEYFKALTAQQLIVKALEVTFPLRTSQSLCA